MTRGVYRPGIRRGAKLGIFIAFGGISIMKRMRLLWRLWLLAR